jgi:6-phosphogluconate dehydrogenase
MYLLLQRDYFGAHTYERVDNPGSFVHTNWTGRGGDVSSTVYNK